jgi:adenosylmethionine-8-amino-7-oxononanoate aminotransferase
MGIVKKEDIAGYQRGDGTIVCTECATDEDTKGLTEDDILTDRQSNNEARGCCQRMGIRITILATVPPTICLKPLPSQPRERTHFRGMPHL